MENYPNNTTWAKGDMYITCTPIYHRDEDITFYLETKWCLLEDGKPDIVGERLVGFMHGEDLSYIPKHEKKDLEWLEDGYVWPKASEFKEVTYRFTITSPLNATVDVKASTKQLAFEKFKDMCPSWKTYVFNVEALF